MKNLFSRITTPITIPTGIIISGLYAECVIEPKNDGTYVRFIDNKFYNKIKNPRKNRKPFVIKEYFIKTETKEIFWTGWGRWFYTKEIVL